MSSLFNLLIETGTIKSAPNPGVYKRSKKLPIAFVCDVYSLNESEVINSVAEKLKIEFLDLKDPKTINRLQIDDFNSDIVPGLCRKHKMIPLFKKGTSVVAAFADPLDIEGARALEFALSCTIEIVIAEESKICALIDAHFPRQPFDYNRLDSMAEGYVELLKNREPQEDIVNVEDSSAPPIIRLVNKILIDGVSSGASDIHIEPVQSGLDVRFRIDGKMKPTLDIPKRLQPYVTSRLKILSEMDIAEKNKPQDGRFRIRVDEDLFDFRVSSIPTAFGEKIVLRVLKSSFEAVDFASLGLPEDIESGILRALKSHGKMLLVTGPTGSGKTTTLYTCLKYLMDGTTNIVTVENPIEYRLEGVNQTQVNEARGVTFASALRSILRQDPDVVMLGEIRDEETAGIAFQAADTGHKVLSTLHTNDAPSTVSRLLTLGIQNYMIGSNVAGILAQRLVRAICPDCKQQGTGKMSDFQAQLALKFGLEPSGLYSGRGCAKCGNSGYRGRQGIFSYLEIKEALSEVFSQKCTALELARAAAKYGFRPLGEDALRLVKAGITTFEEVEPYLIELENRQTSEKDQDSDRNVTEKHPVPEARFEPPPGEPIRAAAGGLRKKKVLLVDDDPHVRAMLALMLKKEMFDVKQAENGREALSSLYEELPDIILCDLMMPEMDGKEFLSRIKSNDQVKGIPVIILTAADSDENEVGLLDLGATDFVSKASDSKIMLARIRKVLK